MDDYVDILTVKHLKEIINDLPDDMPVVIPVIEYDNANHIHGFRFVKTSGVLNNKYEDYNKVLCFNSSENGLDLSSQIQQKHCDSETVLETLLF